MNTACPSLEIDRSGAWELMLFELTSSKQSDDLPIQREPMFRFEEHFSFTAARAPNCTVHSARLGKVRLCRVRSTGHRIALREPVNTTILIPRRGRIIVETASQTLKAAAGEMLLFTPNARVTTVVPDRKGLYYCDCALIPTVSALSGGIRSVARLEKQPPERACLVSTLGRQEAALRGYLDLLFSVGDQDQSLLSNARAREAAGVLLTECLGTLLREAQDFHMRETTDRMADARLVTKAEEIVRARFGESLSVRQIAGELGVSARRLQYAFNRLHEVGPREFLNLVRLDRARELLQHPAECSSVTETALECGFAHFGRFASAYAARFGEAPSQTLRRHRN